jgi:alpha-glucosidase
MSEFDLIEVAPLEPGSVVDWQSQTVAGAAGIAVLRLTLNRSEERPPWPVPGEIPGLLSLDAPPGSHPFGIEQEGEVTTLLWNGQLLMQSWQGPHLFGVEPKGLPGLTCRPGEKLPPDFQSSLRWDWKIADDQRFYGLGQRSTPLERRGTAAANWTSDQPTGQLRDTDPLYQAHPLLWGRTGDTWWAVFLCHAPYSRFDIGQDRHDRMRWLACGPCLEILIHAAASPSDLHASLRQMWEPPTAPPLWSLGFHQSRWGYRSGDEVSRLVEEFRRRDIPLDAVHLDIDHMESYRSFTFSADRFPDAGKTIEELAGQGVRTVTILDPGLRFDPGCGYGACDRGLAGGHFHKSPSGAPVVGYCWPDEALFPDFSRAATRHWWAQEARFYLEHGVAGLWIDMNEPAIFDKPFWTGGAKQLPMPLDTPGGEDERRFVQAAGHNLYGSFMAQATHQTWSGEGRRAWVLTRSGFTGVGRYAWSWMGDNTSWWEHLALSLPQLASMGLVGCPFVGVDIGGFFGHCTAELYSAWIEASVIYPFMRAHSALGTRVAHPWSYGPEVEEIARTAIHLRYRLLPYFYSAAMAQTLGDAPLIRPMMFDYPQDRRFDCLEDQVMVGPHLLAAPFVVRGQSERLVRLPEGIWYDLHTQDRFVGPATITVSRRPGRVPLFARGGSVIPLLGEDVSSSGQMDGKPWLLRLYPGQDHLPTTLYWDDGESLDCQQGRFLKLRIHLQGETVVVDQAQGELAGFRPALRCLLPDGREAPELSWDSRTA